MCVKRSVDWLKAGIWFRHLYPGSRFLVDDYAMTCHCRSPNLPFRLCEACSLAVEVHNCCRSGTGRGGGDAEYSYELRCLSGRAKALAIHTELDLYRGNASYGIGCPKDGLDLLSALQ